MSIANRSERQSKECFQGLNRTLHNYKEVNTKQTNKQTKHYTHCNP